MDPPSQVAMAGMSGAAFQRELESVRADAADMPPDAEVTPSVAEIFFRLKNLEHAFAHSELRRASAEQRQWRTMLRRWLKR